MPQLAQLEQVALVLQQVFRVRLLLMQAVEAAVNLVVVQLALVAQAVAEQVLLRVQHQVMEQQTEAEAAVQQERYPHLQQLLAVTVALES